MFYDVFVWLNNYGIFGSRNNSLKLIRSEKDFEFGLK